MVSKKPIFNLSKIEGIPKRKKSENYIDDLFEDFKEIRTELQKNQKTGIAKNLKNYFIIRLNTWMESELKKMIINLIDKNNLEIKKLFSTGEIIISINDFKILKNKKITEGRLIASNFNFQNKDEINFVFSRLLGLDFYETIQKFILHPTFSKDKGTAGYFSTLNKNWDSLMNLFELRNKIVHSINVTNNLRKNYQYYETMFDCVGAFLVMCETLPDLIINNKKKKIKSPVLIEFFNERHKNYKRTIK